MSDIERIRKLYKASRKQFGEVFLGKSETMVKYYEKGLSEPPKAVMRLAKMWEKIYYQMTGEEECKNNTK